MSERREKDTPAEQPHGTPERHGLVERIVKRGIESGIGAISRSEDTVRAVIDGLKLPREAASVVLDQIDETKKGLYTVVGREVRDFLQGTNLVNDVKKILTGLAFEVKMEVRFKNADEDGRLSLHPEVNAASSIKESRARKNRRPPPDPAEDDPGSPDDE